MKILVIIIFTVSAVNVAAQSEQNIQDAGDDLIEFAQYEKASINASVGAIIIVAAAAIAAPSSVIIAITAGTIGLVSGIIGIGLRYKALTKAQDAGEKLRWLK